MRLEIQKWWEQANEDLATAKDNLNINRYSYSIFLSEPAVEKALKAIYLKKFKEIPKVHDLALFAKKLGLPHNLYENCEDLTNMYTETRYPDMYDKIPAKKFSKEEAIEFLEKAEEVIKWIRERI